MISLFWAALLWCRDIRRIGRELEYQEAELQDPYGLLEVGWGTHDYLERKDRP